MVVHEPGVSRWQPRRLLLAAVLVVALATTGSGGPDGAADSAEASILRARQTSQALSASEHPATPRAETPSEPVPGTGIATPPTSRATSEPEPISSPGVPAMPAADPVRLQIPSIGVDAALIDLGLQADGTLEVPPGGFPAGWYTGSPTPGELGPAIIAGHVDWAGQPGVFYDLRDLTPGDEIAINRQDGSTAAFRVTRIERFAKDRFPTEAVYGDLDHAGLRLITCGGAFDRQARSYVDNIVVFAELIDSRIR